MDDEDIHDRLEQLEATVADQQATIEQLTEQPAIGRRSVVASLLGAGAVGGLAGFGSQSARAQASGPAGQQGTEEEPNDMFAWGLDVQGQVTSDLPMGGNDVAGVGALEAEQASITNQTYIFATLPSSQDLGLVGDYERIGFEADTDNIGGWDDTDNEFTAPEAGNYTINLWVTFDGGSAGDGIRIRYNGAEQQQYLQERGASESGDNRATHQMDWDVDLQADDSIFFEARNDGSTDEIADNDLWTHLTIKRDPRGAT